MQENDKPVLIYSTFPSSEVAETMGRQLVEQRLAACVNIFGGMTSIYRWEGTIEHDKEAAMIIKTREGSADAVISLVKKQHPYTNPALLIIPVDGGSPEYISWLLTESAGEVR